MAPDVPFPAIDPVFMYISPELPPLTLVATAVSRLKSPDTPEEEAPDKILTAPPLEVEPAAPPVREIDPPEVEPVPPVRERDPPTPAVAVPADIATSPPVVVPLPTLREMAPADPAFEVPVTKAMVPEVPLVV